MTNDEARQLARHVLSCSHNPTNPTYMNGQELSDAAHELAVYILLDVHKREIENAAYRRCIEIADKAILDGNSGAVRMNRVTVDQIKNDIRSLIQPPAPIETDTVHESCGCVFCDLNIPRQYSTAAQGYVHNTIKGPITCPLIQPPAQKENGE